MQPLEGSIEELNEELGSSLVVFFIFNYLILMCTYHSLILIINDRYTRAISFREFASFKTSKSGNCFVETHIQISDVVLRNLPHRSSDRARSVEAIEQRLDQSEATTSREHN